MAHVRSIRVNIRQVKIRRFEILIWYFVYRDRAGMVKQLCQVFLRRSDFRSCQVNWSKATRRPHPREQGQCFVQSWRQLVHSLCLVRKRDVVWPREHGRSQLQWRLVWLLWKRESHYHGNGDKNGGQNDLRDDSFEVSPRIVESFDHKSVELLQFQRYTTYCMRANTLKCCVQRRVISWDKKIISTFLPCYCSLTKKAKQKHKRERETFLLIQTI